MEVDRRIGIIKVGLIIWLGILGSFVVFLGAFGELAFSTIAGLFRKLREFGNFVIYYSIGIEG